MLKQMIPQGIGVFETRQSRIEGDLIGSEASAVANAVPARVEEFRLGRNCARRALAHIGASTGEIGMAESRAPMWPSGVVGAITHCPGYCAAVAAWASEFRAIGIDAAENKALPDDVIEQVTSISERRWVQKHRAGALGGALSGSSLIFSIKESIYKAWAPFTGRWLGFEEAVVAINTTDRSFIAELSQSAPGFPAQLAGTYTYDEAVIVSAIVLKT